MTDNECRQALLSAMGSYTGPEEVLAENGFDADQVERVMYQHLGAAGVSLEDIEWMVCGMAMGMNLSLAAWNARITG